MPWIAGYACYLVAYYLGGWPVLVESTRRLLKGTVSIDLLMILAALGAAALGDWLDGGLLLFLFSLSHALEAFILGGTRKAITSLMELTPEVAVVITEEGETQVPVASLQIGQIVVVSPSERIPADGVIEAGQTSIDQSPMTGESVPVDKHPGDPVFSGTLNQEGVIRVRVTRLASESTLARMVQLVEQAQSERASSQQFTDWFGARYTWLVLSFTALSFFWFRFMGDTVDDSLLRAMTILVVASPCAVVISIPAAILAAIAGAARRGILFKGGIHLEQAARLKAMAFDKTGTLTLGRPIVTSVAGADGATEEQVLTLAAGLEANSEHPLARAIREAADLRHLSVPAATNVSAIVGQGVRGQIDSHDILVRKVLPADRNGTTIAQWLEDHQAQGETLVVVIANQKIVGAIGVQDTLRPSAINAIKRLKRLGLAPLLMLTGDHTTVARKLAGQLELGYAAELLPEDKLTKLKELRQQAGSVGMIGDGMNDAPALALADVGITLGGAGTDVALETADIVLMSDDLGQLPDAIELARRTQAVVRQNLIFAFAVMIGLMIYSLRWPLPLPLAVLGHEGSTVIVILNGLRLFWRPRRETFSA